MKHKKLLAIILALALCVGLLPTAFAAQENGYHDPAEHWLTANNRTNELDANAVVTQETFKCSRLQQNHQFTIAHTGVHKRRPDGA